MNNKKNNLLIQCADRALLDSNIIKDNKIKESYNGAIAALGVSIAMTGFRPSLAIYYHKEEKKNILNIVLKILLDHRNTYYSFHDDKMNNGENVKLEIFLRYAFSCPEEKLKPLQKEFLDCCIALKQVVRTYNLV